MFKKRLAQNMGANVFSQFINVLVQLVSVPLFLSFWSKEHYGAWILISSIPAYLSLGEAGFATSSANEVSMAISQGDHSRALRSLHTAWGFLVGISSVLLLLTISAFFVVPWDTWLKSTSVSSSEGKWSILFLSLYSIVGILMAIFGVIYRAAYRNARNTFLNGGARFIELLAIGAGVVMTTSMATIAGLILSARIASFLVMYLDSLTFSPHFNLGLSGFSTSELKRSWRHSFMFMAGTLGNAIYFQGLTLLVGACLGTAAVVAFNTNRTLTRVIVQFVTMIKHSVWPEFSYLFGAGDFVRARQLNELAFEGAGFAALGLALCLFIAAPWIMPKWTHHAVQFDPILLIFFLLSAVLNSIWFVTSGLLMGTNQHEGLTVRYLFAASFSVILAIVLAPIAGIYGVALAMVVCELMLIPYAISRACQLLHQPVKDLLLKSIQLCEVRKAASTYYNRLVNKEA